MNIWRTTVDYDAFLLSAEKLAVISYNNSGSNLQRIKNSTETARVQGVTSLKETDESKENWLKKRRYIMVKRRNQLTKEV
jgi:hypothetical protein